MKWVYLKMDSEYKVRANVNQKSRKPALLEG